MTITGAMVQFCYKDKASVVKHVKGKLHMVMKHHDAVSAKVHFEERAEGQPAKLVPLPRGYSLIKTDTMTAPGMLGSCHHMIHHARDYQLISSEGVVLRITNPMVHVIE